MKKIYNNFSSKPNSKLLYNIQKTVLKLYLSKYYFRVQIILKTHTLQLRDLCRTPLMISG